MLKPFWQKRDRTPEEAMRDMNRTRAKEGYLWVHPYSTCVVVFGLVLLVAIVAIQVALSNL